MKLDIANLNEDFCNAEKRRAHGRHIEKRSRPSCSDYDFLILHALAKNIERALSSIPDNSDSGRRALDLGSATSPYKDILIKYNYQIETFDVEPSSGAEHIGYAHETGLPDSSYDLVLCTQVLEHVPNPQNVMNEIERILRPGGFLVLAVPHVWFYHPCPHDLWRFTQEGVVKLCNESDLKPITLLSEGGSALNLFQIINFLVYGAVGRLGTPLFILLNVLGSALDCIIKNQLFCMNFTCLAQKK